jgi:Ca2+/Na+ antiporter
VRQIEGGLLALLFVVLGLTALLYGIALVSDEGAPGWLGVLGIAASPLTVATGVTVSHAPFEGLTQVPGAVAALLGVGMPLVFLWFLLIALFLFKSSRRRPAHHPASESHDTEGNRTESEEDHVSI